LKNNGQKIFKNSLKILFLMDIITKCPQTLCMLNLDCNDFKTINHRSTGSTFEVYCWRTKETCQMSKYFYKYLFIANLILNLVCLFISHSRRCGSANSITDVYYWQKLCLFYWINWWWLEFMVNCVKLKRDKIISS